MSLAKRPFTFSKTTIDCWSVERQDDDGRYRYWFHGPDMASALGYARPQTAISKHVEPKWKQTWGRLQKAGESQANWKPDLIFISEAGVYSLIHHSKLEDAKIFFGKVFEEVIPAIVCDGHYEKPAEDQTPDRPVPNPPDVVLKFLESFLRGAPPM